MKLLIIDEREYGVGALHRQSVPVKILLAMDFILVITEGRGLFYLKSKANDDADFPFKLNQYYDADRLAMHLLHINDWYAKQRDPERHAEMSLAEARVRMEELVRCREEFEAHVHEYFGWSNFTRDERDPLQYTARLVNGVWTSWRKKWKWETQPPGDE